MYCIVDTYEDQAANQVVGITDDGRHVILGDIVSDYGLSNPKHHYSGVYKGCRGEGVSAAPFIAMGFMAGITGG